MATYFTKPKEVEEPKVVVAPPKVVVKPKDDK